MNLDREPADRSASAAGNSDTGISGRFGDTDSVFCDLYDQEAQTTKQN